MEQKPASITLDDGRTVLVSDLNVEAQRLFVITTNLQRQQNEAALEKLKVDAAVEVFSKQLHAAVVSHFDAKAADAAPAAEAPAAE